MSIFRHPRRSAWRIALFLLLSSLPAAALEHRVTSTDTLYGLARRYGVPVEWIRRANDLDGDVIRVGQPLDIPVDGVERTIVYPGDTLSSLALLFDVPEREIRLLNGLDGDVLRIGQVLDLPDPLPDGRVRVLPGDTLSAIAVRHGLSLDELILINDLEEADVIRPGDLLLVAAPRPRGHRVETGESLWSIADRYGIDPESLAAWNRLETDATIHPGDRLALYAGVDASALPEDAVPDVVLASVSSDPPPAVELPRIGEYFFEAPRASYQPDDRYWEGSGASAEIDDQRAREVLEAFRVEQDRQPLRSRDLKGWHIVLDPGHGGLDPGAIVAVRDGDGNPVVVTEDEYAYDIAMRLYRILRSHGAEVSLTVMAPDHHIRDGEDARRTFVNRKNEVYNDAVHNAGPGWRPVGTADGLDLRKTIAARELRDGAPAARRKGTLFISIHADNSADLPAGTAVLFDGADDEEMASSRALASVMAPRLGSGSFIRRQSLRVLQGNPADAAVLVEARNIHYERNAWALRSRELRQEDAEMIAAGILAWARR